jgi:hypothetical protein
VTAKQFEAVRCALADLCGAAPTLLDWLDCYQRGKYAKALIQEEIK